jgi:starch-binding outer membrane protein, SusD/RagB family
MLKIMKRITILSVLILLMIGCSKDFLDKTPTTSMVVENFYKSPADATQALTSVYNMLINDDWWGALIMSEIASDDCAGGGGFTDADGYQRWDRGRMQDGANVNQDLFRTYYGLIYRANTYIENEKLIDWTGKEDLQKFYLAEAYFLRAYAHFYLAQVFGEIPAITALQAPDIIPPRTPADELYKIILDDLKYSAENGRNEPYQSMKYENWGRITKWAAEAMIGRVFLYYTGYYNKESLGEYTAASVRDYVEDCIKNSGHNLVPQYASLWRVPCMSELGGIGQYAGENNPEAVWSVCYTLITTSTTINKFHRMAGPRDYNMEPYGQGWGGMPVLPSLWNLYENADSRKKATILSWNDEGRVFPTANPQAQVTFYTPKKYMLAAIGTTNEVVALGGTSWQTQGFEDHMMIRFADVLLMGSELRVLTNGENDATALGYLNKVRARAFGDNSHNYSSASISNIFAERKLELACEGLRYWDILRSCKGDFSKLVNILTYNDTSDGGDFGNTSNKSSLDVDGNNFAATKGLFQLPQFELDLMNGIIQQNPGFE